MTTLRKKIVDIRDDKYYGKIVMYRMKNMEQNKRGKFVRDVNILMDKCQSYLDKWHGFDNSNFKLMRILTLKQPMQWDGVIILCENLQLDINMDELYDDICLVKEVCNDNDRIDMR